MFSLILIFSSLSGCLAGDHGGDWSHITFSATDSSGEVSNGTSDELIDIVMVPFEDEDFGWDVTNITILVGDELFICSTHYSTGCFIRQLGENSDIWAGGETLVLVENGVDICSQECDVVVVITSEDIIIPGTPVVNVK
ncbi:MAG: hypothetical protein CXT68_05335 [Methanobacteriota archaeon]|nr:MAG: hypothetical protein CXT68_05335 [Euryarchaeota archaeon]